MEKELNPAQRAARRLLENPLPATMLAQANEKNGLDLKLGATGQEVMTAVLLKQAETNPEARALAEKYGLL